MMQTLWQDLRYAVRVLLKKPGFTLIVVLTLALGIAASAPVSTWLTALLLQPLPGVGDSHRRVMLHSAMTRSGNQLISVCYAGYKDYRDRNEVFSGLAASNIN